MAKGIVVYENYLWKIFKSSFVRNKPMMGGGGYLPKIAKLQPTQQEKTDSPELDQSALENVVNPSRINQGCQVLQQAY